MSCDEGIKKETLIERIHRNNTEFAQVFAVFLRNFFLLITCLYNCLIELVVYGWGVLRQCCANAFTCMSIAYP